MGRKHVGRQNAAVTAFKLDGFPFNRKALRDERLVGSSSEANYALVSKNAYRVFPDLPASYSRAAACVNNFFLGQKQSAGDDRPPIHGTLSPWRVKAPLLRNQHSALACGG